MTNIRTIITPYFTLSAKYVSGVSVSRSTKKRFLRPNTYISEIVVNYYNELCEGKTHTLRIETNDESQYLKKTEELEQIKEYIEMDMGSSCFPVECQ
jgi:hypothetical protein